MNLGKIIGISLLGVGTILLIICLVMNIIAITLQPSGETEWDYMRGYLTSQEQE